MPEEQQTLMLDDIHVVDFSQYLAGAGVSRMLAEMGADITKVEIGPIGDGGRLLPVLKDDRRTSHAKKILNNIEFSTQVAFPEQLATFRV